MLVVQVTVSLEQYLINCMENLAIIWTFVVLHNLLYPRVHHRSTLIRFLYFKFFERINQFVTPSEAWHYNSDIVWRKKISLTKNSVLKVLILIVCWPENGRPLLVPSRNDVWLTREDQQRMTNEVSLLRVFLIGWNKFHFWNYEYMKIIYVNCGVKNYLKEGHRICIRNLCMQLGEESLKNNSGLYGIRTLDLCDAGRQRSTN